MSITTLVAMKEAALSYQPLLLATITFPNGDILRLATLPLNVAEGGVQYLGNDYLGRILQQDIKAVQAMDSLGIDRVPQVALHVADADAYVWQNYQMNPVRGFKGAILQLDLIGYDVDAGTFTSDVDTKFVGPCQPPDHDASTVTITAQAKINTQQTFLPPVRIQPRCPWVFPADAASQADSVNDDSTFYECGYNPGAGRGIAGFTFCDYQRASCVARGMSVQGGRGSFGGITFTPPLYWRSLSYTQQKIIQGTNSVNDSKWGDTYPILYGTTWVNAKVQNIIGDGNSTRLEAVLCAAQLVGTRGIDPGSVQKVLFNDTEVPFVAYSQDPKLFRWDWVNNGSRDGKQNTDAQYVDTAGNPLGDWYGNLACIEVCVPIELASSSSAPTLSVLVTGPALPVYQPVTNIVVAAGVGVLTVPSTLSVSGIWNDPSFAFRILGATGCNGVFGLTTWTNTTITFPAAGVANGTYTGGFLRYKAQTDNPVWALMDAYEWANVRASEINLASFVAAAAICDQQINFVNQSGSTVNVDSDGSPHKRYRISAAFSKLTAASDIITGLRNGFRAYVDWQGGLLNLRLMGTLAEQQSAAIVGSNTSTPVSSVLRDGSTASGYPAYSFGPGSIKRVNGDSTITCSTQKNAPNQITYSFQDKDNGYQQDTINGTDSTDAQLIGAVLTQNLSVIGPNTFDQGMRITAQMEAELHYGNASSSKPIGTQVYQFLTTFRAEHLRPGHIVLLNDAREGLSNQLARVISIGGGTNLEEMAITVQWHKDAWYLDTFGQTTSGSTTGNNGRSPVNRPPYPWGPDYVPPLTGDPLYPSQTDYTFDIEPDTSVVAKDGSVIAQIALNGIKPINSFGVAQPPSLVPQATLSGSSGPFVGPASFFLAVCSIDSNGKYSAPSVFSRADIASGAQCTSITISIPNWGANTNTWEVFAGTDPRRLTNQLSGSGTPATITLTTYTTNGMGLPDPEINAMRTKLKQIILPGLVLGAATALTGTGSSGTIQIAGSTWTTNQWAGYIVSDLSVPYLANFAITSNTADTLTVTRGPLSPISISRPFSKKPAYTHRANVGDMMVIRSKPTISVDGSGNTVLTDASWVNSSYNAGAGLPTTGGGVVGNFARIIAGTGRGKYAKIIANTTTSITTEPFTITLDSTSVPIVEAPNWAQVSDIDSFINASDTALVTLKVPVANFAGSCVGVQVLTLAGDDTESPDIVSPYRETWIAGGSGNTYNGAAYLGVPGTLAIGSNLSPLVFLGKSTQATAVQAQVKAAPSGAALAFTINVNGVFWLSMTIASGATLVSAAPGTILALAAIPAGAQITLDITGTGTTFPGADFTCIIFA